MAGKCSVEGCLCEKYEEQEKKELKGRNWWKPLAIGGGAVGGLALAQISMPAALSVIGFTSSGIVNGSIAAYLMSISVPVAATGPIGIMQSIGAEGLGAMGTAVGGIVGGAAGFAVSTAAGAGKDDSKNDKKCSCDKTCNNCHHCKCRHLR